MTFEERPFGTEARIGAFCGRIHPDFDTPGFREALAGLGALTSGPSARVLLDRRNRVMTVDLPLTADSRVEAVVKEFRSRGFKKGKTLVVPGKAVRAWRGAAACLVRGVRTPLPLACLERRAGGIVAEGFFLAARVADAREIRDLFRTLPPSELSRLLETLAAFLRGCHDRGILHRDLSDGNILVRTGASGDFELFLIDTNRIRVRRSIPAHLRLRNLVRLGVPRESRDAFLGFYLGSGEGPGFRTARGWYRLNKSCYTGFVSLKKKLRLRRLAERLGIQ